MNSQTDELADGDAPTPWISLADAILATLAAFMILGILILVFVMRMVANYQILPPGYKAVPEESIVLEEDQRAVPKESIVLKEDQRAVPKESIVLKEDQRAVPKESIVLKEDQRAVPKKSIVLEEDQRAVPKNSTMLKEGEKAVPKNSIVLKENEKAVPKDYVTFPPEGLDKDKTYTNKPIVLGLDDVEGNNFALGSAELNEQFQKQLSGEVFNKISDVVDSYNIEVIEIVGHTDGTHVGNRSGNLDASLNELSMEQVSLKFIGRLKGSSNADLGLMRALSVASFLGELTRKSENPKIRDLVFRTYSGAQLIDPSTDTIVGARKVENPKRRRIELRFTRKSIALEQ